MTLPKDFRDCAALFVAHSVRFMIVGGHAVMAHGFPRFTDDFDLWVEPTMENGERVVAALAAFGFASEGLQAADFVSENVVVQLGYPPRRIDVLTSISGVTFESCYPGRIDLDAEGLILPLIGRDCLLANKRASGRRKDLLDVEGLGAEEAEP